MQKYKYLRKNEDFSSKFPKRHIILTENEKDTQQETDHDNGFNFYNFPFQESKTT